MAPLNGSLILIVEDETRIAEVLEKYLRAQGFRTEWAADGRRALELWRAARPDLVLLDLMIPPPDGLEVLRTIRRDAETPVIVLTAKVDEIDRLLGLELGADDYVTKPFSAREIVARVKAVLRRVNGSVKTPQRLKVGDLELDPEAFQARCKGSPLNLTAIHLKLLQAFMTHPGKAFSRSELLDVFGEEAPDERTIDAHIKNLRARMGECGGLLETVRGIGYRLSADL